MNLPESRLMSDWLDPISYNPPRIREDCKDKHFSIRFAQGKWIDAETGRPNCGISESTTKQGSTSVLQEKDEVQIAGWAPL